MGLEPCPPQPRALPAPAQEAALAAHALTAVVQCLRRDAHDLVLGSHALDAPDAWTGRAVALQGERKHAGGCGYTRTISCGSGTRSIRCNSGESAGRAVALQGERKHAGGCRNKKERQLKKWTKSTGLLAQSWDTRTISCGSGTRSISCNSGASAGHRGALQGEGKHAGGCGNKKERQLKEWAKVLGIWRILP
eukprot:1157807-Pelagomonas_calceolata.AAC.2